MPKSARPRKKHRKDPGLKPGQRRLPVLLRPESLIRDRQLRPRLQLQALVDGSRTTEPTLAVTAFKAVQARVAWGVGMLRQLEDQPLEADCVFDDAGRALMALKDQPTMTAEQQEAISAALDLTEDLENLLTRLESAAALAWVEANIPNVDTSMLTV